ncbi:MAG: hypothetical protein JWN17_962 [Frankiales bacterium]|nr:hypothetical protein [Frankiales bacterium]
MRRPLAVLLASAACALGLALPGAATAAPPADGLRAGVGRADLTSPTGYYMQGWVRADAVLRGVHTRIEARAIVLERGGRKVALVAVGLNGVAEGVVAEAAARLRSRGFGEDSIVVSASHTHAAPSGYYDFATYNTVFPSTVTLTDPAHLADQNVQGALDPQLYRFEVDRLVQAITRADDDLGPARLGWGTATLTGVTRNRSLEAHLHDHGITEEYGHGTVAQDPSGYVHTIDPEVQVLRVDKQLAGRYRPVGTWSTFADHGTVNRYTFGVYNDDHHGAANREVERVLRAEGDVPAGQDVVNAYGNTDEGDMSAGLDRTGPAYAEEVGRREAAAMVTAWRRAGSALTDRPELDTRWTRMCFCGQDTAAGPTSKTAVAGLPLFTGSEEGRGPLYDVTKQPFEGYRLPVADPVDPTHGVKIQVTRQGGGPPSAVPLLVVRVGKRLIATVPGEMTVEMGRRVRAAVLAASAGTGVEAVQISGLANEYLSYFPTPEEYDMQHYEGGSTMFGRTSSVLLQEQLATLAGQLAKGTPATPPYAFDPRNGVKVDGAPFGTGATTAKALSQPHGVQRLARAAFAWQGGPRGLDMPAGRAFVTVERRAGAGWVRSTDDLGQQLLWRVDDAGRYDLQWEVPRSEPVGAHRLVVTGNHYRLVSSPFAVAPSTRLSVEPAGRVRYPDAVPEVDLTYRPAAAEGAPRVTRPAAAGAVRDRFGNCNGAAVTLSGRTGDAPTADPAVCLAASGRPAPAVRPAVGGAMAGPGTLPTTGGTPVLPLVAALSALGAVVARLALRRPTG